MSTQVFGFKLEETNQLLPEVFTDIEVLKSSLRVSYSKVGQISFEAYEVTIKEDGADVVIGYIVPLEVHTAITHL
ncbi:hypothetical protein VP150E351_P0076 [Vibrio phage 150E35-1]|nr:hypothetical protein VP150E351_P0076 [Vibrio phage 150E35-1]